MIRGETVVVLHPYFVGEDDFNNPIRREPYREVVPNVLIAPSTTTDDEAARPFGYVTTLTLHFPKDFEGDLRGCEIELPNPYPPLVRVVGEPTPYMYANVPPMVPWSMPVTVEVANG